MLRQYPAIDEIINLGEGIWRVDWFGAIERNPSIPTEFVIRVILSRIRENWKSPDIETDDAVHNESRRSVLIGVGQLPFVYIGSLWREGKRLAIKAGKILTINLNIGPATTNISKSMDSVEDQTLIPFNSHQVSGAGKDALCVHITHNGDSAGIIIPTVEIIRFYFATSSLLSKAVFDGSFTHNLNSIIDPEYTGMAGNRCVVNRRKEVSDDDCWAIGRILNAPEAYEAVRLINDSLLKAQVNNLEAFPQTGFPFSGETAIQARCKQIGWKKKRWLVLSLISCSGEFPYEELEVIADNDSSKADPNTDIPDSEKLIAFPNSKLVKGDVEPTDLSLQSTQEPESIIEDYKIVLQENRFAAIQDKKIIKSIKEKCLYKARALKPRVKLDAISSLGTGNGDHNVSGVVPAQIQTDQDRRGLPASWESLIEMLEVLNQYPGIEARPRQFPWGIGLMEAKKTNRSNKRQWSYLNFRTRKIRRFMVADIQYLDNYFTVLEIERRADSPSDSYLLEILYKTGGVMISVGELDHISMLLSRVNGRMRNIPSLPSSINRLGAGMKHTWKDAHDYAEAIVAYLESLNLAQYM